MPRGTVLFAVLLALAAASCRASEAEARAEVPWPRLGSWHRQRIPITLDVMVVESDGSPVTGPIKVTVEDDEGFSRSLRIELDSSGRATRTFDFPQLGPDGEGFVEITAHAPGSIGVKPLEDQWFSSAEDGAGSLATRMGVARGPDGELRTWYSTALSSPDLYGVLTLDGPRPRDGLFLELFEFPAGSFEPPVQYLEPNITGDLWLGTRIEDDAQRVEIYRWRNNAACVATANTSLGTELGRTILRRQGESTLELQRVDRVEIALFPRDEVLGARVFVVPAGEHVSRAQATGDVDPDHSEQFDRAVTRMSAPEPGETKTIELTPGAYVLELWAYDPHSAAPHSLRLIDAQPFDSSTAASPIEL